MIQMGLDMKPMNSGLYTVGYGDLTEEQFLKKINGANIALLIDVRGDPYTESFGLRRMSSLLGNRYRSIPKLGGLVYPALRYNLWKENALKELDEIYKWSKWGAVCLMCTEAEHSRCHRTYFIARALKELYGIKAIHL